MAIKAQLFITCLAEQFYPQVLEQMVGLLEKLGVGVMVPTGQTCCGQPFYNSGFQGEARKMARQWLKVFADEGTYVVSPSGSCVDMVRHHYLELFPEGTPECALAHDLAGRTFEFTDFLVNVLGVTDVGARYPHRVTYHASCHQRVLQGPAVPGIRRRHHGDASRAGHDEDGRTEEASPVDLQDHADRGPGHCRHTGAFRFFQPGRDPVEGLELPSSDHLVRPVGRSRDDGFLYVASGVSHLLG